MAFNDYMKSKPNEWRGGYTEACLEDCWNAAIKHAEALKPSHNSDYAAALQDLKMFIHSRLQVHPELQCELGFIWERLNALKAEHFGRVGQYVVRNPAHSEILRPRQERF